MNLDNGVSRLAREDRGRRRCKHCRDWPKTRVVLADDWQDTGVAEGLHEPPIPEMCPWCGFVPQTVTW